MSSSAVAYEYVRPHLYGKQEEFLFAPERYSIVEASTKSGKTAGCLVWLGERGLLNGAYGQSRWWVAPTFAQTKIAFRRMKRMLPRDHYEVNESELYIHLLNDSLIWFKSGDNPDSLYAEDVYDAVIDEASRVKEESWHAVRSTLAATGGHLRIIGNVKGRKNWAYRLARMAEGGAPDMAYFKLTAHDAVDAGILTEAEVEDARRTLPENVFRELFMAEPSDDGGNPFGITAIRACVKKLSVEQPKVWGWDLAKSSDWTVGIALDAQGRTCRFERWQGPWEHTISRIRSLTGSLPALVDSTGVGDPVLESLQKGSSGNFEGFKFTSTSKQQLMEGLAVAIQQKTVTYPDGPIANELESFEYEYTRTGARYSAPEGLFDDCVCALALAVHKLNRPVARPRVSVISV